MGRLIVPRRGQPLLELPGLVVAGASGPRPSHVDQPNHCSGSLRGQPIRTTKIDLCAGRRRRLRLWPGFGSFERETEGVRVQHGPQSRRFQTGNGKTQGAGRGVGGVLKAEVFHIHIGFGGGRKHCRKLAGLVS